MKKIYVVLFFLAGLFICSFFYSTSAQVCTPDLQYTNGGIYPDTVTDFDTACLGIAYNQVITIVLPADTPLLPPPTPPIKIDSAVLVSLNNLPPGLILSCNNSTCSFKGGTTDCALISGVPTTVGVYDLTGTVNAYIGGAPTPQPQPLSNFRIVVCEVAVTISSSSDTCNAAIGKTSATIISGCSSPFTYQWSNGATSSALNGLNAGNYNVTVTTNNGCIAVSTATINAISTGLTIDSITSVNSSSCFTNDGSLTPVVSGGQVPLSFIWSNGQTSSALNNLGTGTYYVTVTDKYGCSAISLAFVNSTGNLTAVISNVVNDTCSDDSVGQATVMITDGTPPYTYSWNTIPVQTAATATGLHAGTFTVEITDSAGCQIYKQVTIIALYTVTVSNITIQNESTLNDGMISFTPTGGTQPYTYQWSPPVSSDTIANGLNGGTYSITITDANGCSAVETVDVVDGIFEIMYDDGIAIYPNPVQRKIFIAFYSKSTSPASIKIHNILGKEVFKNNPDVLVGNNKMILNLSALPDGIYYLTYHSDRNVFTKRISKISNL